MKKASVIITKYLFLIFFMSGPLFAQTAYEQALEAYENENYSRAFELFEPLANGGDDDAQFYMGNMYEYGEGVEQSFEKAYEWFLKSAEAGDLDSQYRVATLYRDGDGVEADELKAFEWFMKAAQQGHMRSQFMVGLRLDLGEVVEQDHEQAAYWYQQSADQGEATAKAYLGELYQFGKGVSQDFYRAITLYIEAIGIENDEYAVSQLDSIIEENTPEDQSYNETFVLMSELYQSGNTSGAINGFQQLVDAGDRNSQVLMGTFYEQGAHGLGQSFEKAHDLYLKAALTGLDNAQYSLGVLYGRGTGVEQNMNVSKYWIQKAAEQGHELAQQALSQFDF